MGACMLMSRDCVKLSARISARREPESSVYVLGETRAAATGAARIGWTFALRKKEVLAAAKAPSPPCSQHTLEYPHTLQCRLLAADVGNWGGGGEEEQIEREGPSRRLT